MLHLTREEGQIVIVGENKITVTKVKKQQVSLEISRKIGQILMLDETTKIFVKGVQRKQAQLIIEAKKDVPIIRGENSKSE